MNSTMLAVVTARAIPPYPTFKVMWRAFYLVAVLITMPVYTLVTVAIGKYRKQAFTSSFFSIFFVCAILDHIKMLFYYLPYGIPLWGIGLSFYRANRWIAKVGVVTINTVEPCVNICTVYMSVNRMIAVVSPMKYKRIWSESVTKWTTIAMLIVGPLSAWYVWFTNVTYIDAPAYRFGYDCIVVLGLSDSLDFIREALNIKTTSAQFNLMTRTFIRTVTLSTHSICYVVIFGAIYKHYLEMRKTTDSTVSQVAAAGSTTDKRGTNKATTAADNNKTDKLVVPFNMAELRLAAASCAISATDVVTTLISFYAAYNTSFIYKDVFRYYVIMEGSVIFNVIVSPWALLATSGNVREYVGKLIRKKA